jgi:hypothetical protein
MKQRIGGGMLQYHLKMWQISNIGEQHHQIEIALLKKLRAG